MPASKDPATSAGCNNFRRNGDSYKQVRMIHGGEATLTDEQIHTHVVSNTLAFAPEAKGLRTHSLYYDSTLLSRSIGLRAWSTIAATRCLWLPACVHSGSRMRSWRSDLLRRPSQGREEIPAELAVCWPGTMLRRKIER